MTQQACSFAARLLRLAWLLITDSLRRNVACLLLRIDPKAHRYRASFPPSVVNSRDAVYESITADVQQKAGSKRLKRALPRWYEFRTRSFERTQKTLKLVGVMSSQGIRFCARRGEYSHVVVLFSFLFLIYMRRWGLQLGLARRPCHCCVLSNGSSEPLLRQEPSCHRGDSWVSRASVSALELAWQSSAEARQTWVCRNAGRHNDITISTGCQGTH